MYYGSKISSNMTKTPEGYLICHNVPIGRVGTMDYLGEEIGLTDKIGQKIKVNRTPEELFSKATMASFEGKPVTDEHPSNNLDVNTISMMSRGHLQNIREDGDFLMGDLYITDAGLISKIENGKREVSCGYDCLWVANGEGFEQKEIIGNHVAVVQNGRAGHRVAIKDAMPEITKNEGRKEHMKMSSKILKAIGFKAFVQDAEPEEIAKAMDAFNEGEETEKEVKDEGGTSEILAAISALADRITALEQSDKEVHEEVGADAEFEGLEKEMENKDEAGSETIEPEVKDAEPEEGEEKPAADSMIKFIKDMKPIIMAIPDEKARLAAAKQFSKSVRDSRAAGVNGYSSIVASVAGTKKAAMDKAQNKKMTQQQALDAQCEAWNRINKGGK